jgi:16S rRNA processing protein RimM
MDLTNYYCLGQILKPKGFDGSVLVVLDTDNAEKYAKLNYLFWVANGKLEKITLTKMELHKNKTCTLKMEGVNTMDDAKKLQQQKIYLPLTELPEIGDKQFYFHEIPGYTVIDHKQGAIGKAKSVMEMPEQNLLLVEYGSSEIIIPLWKNVVQKIDRAERKLFIQSPDGIIDAYLSGNDEEE